LWIIADEIYSRLVYDGRKFTSIAEVSPEVRERTIVIDGVSKTFAMTGWRIGWAAGPKEVIGGMARIQSHSTSNATSIAQWASVEALRSATEEAAERAKEFELRRNEMVRLLRELPGVRCGMPDGAFYVFPHVAESFGERKGGGQAVRCGAELAAFLLERAKVAVVPGEAFGSADHVRFSYAVSVERIREGVGRVAEALNEIG
jgi:aspartate aminotransferase